MNFEIYAVRYAGPAKSSGAFLLWLKDWDLSMERNYYFWALRAGDETTLVDAGASPAMAAQMNLPSYIPQNRSLTGLGVEADQVDKVILTHLHWDHAGGLDFFPRATFYVHAREYAFWLEDPVSSRGPFQAVSDRETLDRLAELKQAGRVVLVESDGEMLPGITALAAPGHTPGLMALAVDTEAGRAVLGSDCGHLFRNYAEQWPSSLICDLPAWMRSFDKLTAEAGSLDLLFPGHDPLMSQNYPEVAEGITRLA